MCVFVCVRTCVLVEGYLKEILYVYSKKNNLGKYLSHLDFLFLFSVSITIHIVLIVEG